MQVSKSNATFAKEGSRKKGRQFESELTNVKDIEYLGNIFIGTPQS